MAPVWLESLPFICNIEQDGRKDTKERHAQMGLSSRAVCFK
jgi:hypothetical protein